MTDLSKEEVFDQLKVFKVRRDELLYEDNDTFEHNLERFIKHIEKNPLLESFLTFLEEKYPIDIDEWWKDLLNIRESYGKISFPDNPDEEMALRHQLIRSVESGRGQLFSFGRHFGKSKLDESKDLFRSIVIKPFIDELSRKLTEVAELATPESVRIQAIPLSRIPSPNESMIFLSHKGKDKPLAKRISDMLSLIGFSPWLDKPQLPAGSNLERGLLNGFKKSCAAVFFITENFKDENYLATEIVYAIRQKRKKKEKFAIITVRFNKDAPIPELLEHYVYQDVDDELEALKEIVRALPIELGPIRWKIDIAN